MTLETRDLLLLGQDLGFPAVSCGRAQIVGERGWRAALYGARPCAPGERAQVLKRLERHLLVASPGGRVRTRAWIARQRVTPADTAIPQWLLERWIEDKLQYYGDDGALAPVARALASLPAPVRDAVAAEAAILTVGHDTLGWTGPAQLVDRDGARPRRLIVLSATNLDDLGRLVAHEASHLWHAPVDTTWPMPTAIGYRRLLELADREGWRDRADERIARDERLARALEQIWAPPRPATRVAWVPSRRGTIAGAMRPSFSQRRRSQRANV
jgi:hypothetical protein